MSEQTPHTTAIIDVGGGFRAIFGAGVLDRCLEEGVAFDHCYGVSAGSALRQALSSNSGRFQPGISRRAS